MRITSFLISILCVFCTNICHASHTTREIIEHFFTDLFLYTEVGYVLEGVKPACWLSFGVEPTIHNPYSQNKKSSIRYEGFRVWKERIQPYVQDGECLLYIYEEDNGARSALFINKKVLLKIVQDNIDLLKYLVSPLITPETFLEELHQSKMFSPEKRNPVFLGIILGYGTENALYEGTFEKFFLSLFSVDLPPYKSKCNTMMSFCKEKNWDSDRFTEQYWCPRTKRQLPSQDIYHIEMEEEAYAINKMRKAFPEDLLTHFPKYSFSMYEDNPLLLQTLLETQKKIQEQVRHPNFIEDTLKKFGLSLEIQNSIFTKATNNELSNTSSEYLSDIVAKNFALTLLLNEYTKEEKELFLQGVEGNIKVFLDMKDSLFIKNIQIAKKNVQQSLLFFKSLKNQAQEIVPDLLYALTLKEGNGTKIQSTKVQLNYLIRDPNGAVLAEEKAKWINLANTIPGFGHGIQGMRKGEVRRIYIHPSLGYGLETFLQQGISLIADVTLLDANTSSTERMPPLNPKKIIHVLEKTWFLQTQNDYQESLRIKGRELRAFLDESTLTQDSIKKLKMYLFHDRKDILMTEQEKKDFALFFWSISTLKNGSKY